MAARMAAVSLVAPSPPFEVARGSLRVAQDFSRDTPQPKLVSSKRGYLHRRAKEGSPFGKGDGSPFGVGAGSKHPLEDSGSPAASPKPRPASPTQTAVERLGTAVKSLQFD